MRKVFFFEKKKQKTFACLVGVGGGVLVNQIELIAADRDLLNGILADASAALLALCVNGNAIADQVRAVAGTTIALYDRTNAMAPWLTYFGRIGASREIVGVCSFVAPPMGGKSEIAYFTFPAYEGRGVATGMAALLIALARERDDCGVLTANTLHEENTSTRILRRHGFVRAGSIVDDEVGEAWHWRLPLSREWL